MALQARALACWKLRAVRPPVESPPPEDQGHMPLVPGIRLAMRKQRENVLKLASSELWLQRIAAVSTGGPRLSLPLWGRGACKGWIFAVP